jgi:transcriptional regulator with XRE-family HTH domain
MDDALDHLLAAIGPRLRALRQQHHLTLADLSSATGISVSTLSRLEAGRRRPNLELLLPLARAYRVPLDALVGTPLAGDPRVQALPFTQHGITFLPLTRRPGGLQAYKMIIPADRHQQEPELQVHDGYE